MPDLNYQPQTATEKGGGFRGGPRRWTGNGPRPARHVPWPEIFKHHISVLEGHFKMLDMVRKHTVEGTGNHRTITNMVERTQESLHQIKDVQRSFAPPNTRDQVPIGSSSASMYPGYSPADITYGQAAEEVGQQWSQAKKEGLELRVKEDHGLEYEIGQSRGAKRKRVPISELKAKREEENGATNGGAVVGKGIEGGEENGEECAPDGGLNQYFVVDTNPTPINVSEMHGFKKEKKDKKRKADQESPTEPEKKKIKKETKGSSGNEKQTVTAEPEKKKKKKKAAEEEESTADPTKADKKKKRTSEQRDSEEQPATEPEKKKKKKSKKAKATSGLETSITP